MMLGKISSASGPGQPAEKNGAATRRIFFCRLFLAAIIFTVPATALLLIAFRWLNRLNFHPDMIGLTAISIGIIGVLVFFIFLYKYQTSAPLTMQHRWILLAVHLLSVFLLFLLVMWLGFASPWSRNNIWGNYDLETASRTWVITVIVVGAISLLGGLFNTMRLYTRPNPDDE